MSNPYNDDQLPLDDSPDEQVVDLSAEQKRIKAMQGSPAEREHYTKHIAIHSRAYQSAVEYVDNLLARSARSLEPGGLWLLGEGGVGKSFVLKYIRDRYPPSETTTARRCPVISLTFSSRPTEKEIISLLLMQLGQDPSMLRFQTLSELEHILVLAIRSADTLAILMDEAHHVWLNVNAARVADRIGGQVGDFLKRLYDRTGVALIFCGMPGMERILMMDSQAKTRWNGVFRLSAFSYDVEFLSVLASLDECLPMPEKSNLHEADLSAKIYKVCDGNFRVLKNFLAQAVFFAAEAGSHSITPHLSMACRMICGQSHNPFEENAHA